MPAEKMHKDEVDTDAASLGRCLRTSFLSGRTFQSNRLRGQAASAPLKTLGSNMLRRAA
jgi:hypothetical protein